MFKTVTLLALLAMVVFVAALPVDDDQAEGLETAEQRWGGYGRGYGGWGRGYGGWGRGYGGWGGYGYGRGWGHRGYGYWG